MRRASAPETREREGKEEVKRQGERRGGRKAAERRDRRPAVSPVSPTARAADECRHFHFHVYLCPLRLRSLFLAARRPSLPRVTHVSLSLPSLSDILLSFLGHPLFSPSVCRARFFTRSLIQPYLNVPLLVSQPTVSLSSIDGLVMRQFYDD